MPARLSDDVIMGLLEMEAESQELDRSEVGITDELEAAIDAYEAALETALEEVVERWPPADGATIEDLEDVGKAAYLVLMTLRGEGVGIWDGDWDEFYSREEIDEIEEYLKRKLGKFADDSGSGSLNEAFMNAAWETAGGEEEDEEEDDGDTDVPDEGYLGNARWSRAYIDSLPDSHFLYVDRRAATSKDRQGRSHPLSSRHFPYKDKQGRVNIIHVKNALSRIPQSDVSKTAQTAARRKAERILAQHGGYQHAANRRRPR